MQFAFYKQWMKIALHTFAPSLYQGVGLRHGLKHIAVAGVLQGLLAGLYTISTNISADISTFLILLIMTPIGYVVGTLVFSLLLSGLARAFGGKASHKQFVGSIAFVNAAIAGTWMAALAALVILGELTGLGTQIVSVTALVGLLVSLYWLYVVAKVTKTMHGLDKWKTVILVIVISVVLALVLQGLFPTV
jgi:hypothetical protein